MSIEIGKKCPDFEKTSSYNKALGNKRILGVKPVVIFFYPKDFTPGCTKEACSFRDNYEVFQSHNCEVIGVSMDSAKSHEKFTEKHQLPYPLLADRSKELKKMFDVPSSLFGLIPGRATYIIDADGILRGIYNSQSDPFGHIQKALEVVKTF